MNIYPENAVILAPLAGYTDVPYRHSCRRHGCIYAFTEMVDTGSLIYAKGRTRNFLDRASDEGWLGVQVVGSKIDEIEKAIEIINHYNFSVLDINMGCPTPKVVRKGKGAGLAKTSDSAAKIIELMVSKSKFPVTAKIRVQDVENPEPTINLVKKIELAGVNAVTIHGRLLKAIYSGPCYTNIIRSVRESVNVQVIANGGVMNYENYNAIRKETGCGPVMIARGAMGNPWIFEEIETGSKRFIDTEELCNEIELHINEVAHYYDEVTAMKLSRKIILDYMEGRGYYRALKCEVVKIKTISDFKEFMKELRKGPTKRYLNSMSNK